jgi:hypothetical protein
MLDYNHMMGSIRLTVTPTPKKRKTTAIIEESRMDQIKASVQGAVYCFCNVADQGAKFSARDLFGAYDSLWNATPLMALHQWHVDNDADDPAGMAGKDLRWILLDVLDSDVRQFHKSKEVVNVYEWLPSEGVGV